MDYGAWEGLTHRQIDERDARARREWERDPARVACPGGESGDDVARRVRLFLSDMLAEHQAWYARASFRAATSVGGSGGAALERSVLVVAPSTLNRILVCVALGADVADFRRRFVQDHANLTVLRWEAGAGPADGTLVLANDVGHLRAADQRPWA